MKGWLYFLCFLMCGLPFSAAYGQALPVLWQRTIGGSGDDRLLTMKETSDGGYIVAGVSKSGISGLKSQGNQGDYDYWIIKLDQWGGIVWQKTYGGTHVEIPYCIIQTSDGGYIVAGTSTSGISGDKLQNNRGTVGSLTAGFDYWIVKLDATGNEQWQKTYGAAANDVAYSVVQRKDDGYTIAGLSEWRSHEPAGDRATATYRWNDFWILKLDAAGNILRQGAFGGSAHDNPFHLVHTDSEEYLFLGHSASNMGTGTKTSPRHGDHDTWMVKADTNFIEQWQLSLGGTSDDWSAGGGDMLENSGEGAGVQTTDGGFMIGSSSLSGISGNKATASYGGWDWWIVKVDPAGSIVWQKTLGGSGDDRIASSFQTSDGGYLVAGTSNSPVSGDKTENSRGGNDYWIVKLDASRSIIWQQVFGGSDDDQITTVSETSDGGYILGGFSKSGISGEKTEASYGDYDFWIIKLGVCDTTVYVSDSFCYGASYLLPGGRNVSLPGVYTDSLKSIRGCDSIVVTTLTYFADSIHLLNGAILGNDTFFCEGEMYTLDATNIHATAYLWSTSDIVPQLTVDRTGSYWVQLSSPNGCLASDTVQIFFNQSPRVDLGSDTAVCESRVPFRLASEQPAGSVFRWSNGLSDTQMLVRYSGTFWLEVSVGNCIGSDTIQVNVVPDPLLRITDDTIICEQFPLRLGMEIPGATYAWNTGDTTPYIAVNSTGMYMFDVNLQGCVVRDTIQITAMPVPDIDLGDDGDICAEQTIVLDASYQTGSRYLWNTGDTTPTYSVTSAGIYSVEVISEHGCIGSDEIALSFYPKPVVTLGADTVVCEETPLRLDMQALNADSIRWNDGTSGNVLFVHYGGEYVATGVNKCGTGSDTIIVSQIFCGIWLPNAFTPNNDGKNDVFRILGNTGRLEGVSLSIYNRWGERVFITSDKYIGWDGYHKSRPAETGTYVYLLEYSISGTAYKQSGNFHLLR